MWKIENTSLKISRHTVSNLYRTAKSLQFRVGRGIHVLRTRQRTRSTRERTTRRGRNISPPTQTWSARSDRVTRSCRTWTGGSISSRQVFNGCHPDHMVMSRGWSNRGVSGTILAPSLAPAEFLTKLHAMDSSQFCLHQQMAPRGPRGPGHT